MVQHALWNGAIADHDGLAAPHDAGLLAADRLARLAEELPVIEVDADDQRAVGVDRVRRVEPPAHADLEDDDVELAAREEIERCDERCLEI